MTIERQLCWICGSQVWACVCSTAARVQHAAAVDQLIAIIRVVVPLAAAAQEANAAARICRVQTAALVAYWKEVAIGRDTAYRDAAEVLSMAAAQRDQLQDALSAACDSLGEIMLAIGVRSLLLRPIKNETLRAGVAARGRTDAQLSQIAVDAFEAAALMLAGLGHPGATVFTCTMDDGRPIKQVQKASDTTP